VKPTYVQFWDGRTQGAPENDAKVTRGVEMMLLVKDAGVWRIAPQASDVANASNPLPRDLLSPR
jgi:hypothetical protein